MQLTPYEISLIAGGFGIAGSLLGVFLSYRFALKIASANFDNAIRINNISAHKDAANNLRAAFAPQLAAIRFDQSKSAADIQRLLEFDIDKLTIEMEKFRFYISPESCSAYDEACKKYQAVARIREMNYSTLGGKEPFKVFEVKVNDILRFTKL